MTEDTGGLLLWCWSYIFYVLLLLCTPRSNAHLSVFFFFYGYGDWAHRVLLNDCVIITLVIFCDMFESDADK